MLEVADLGAGWVIDLNGIAELAMRQPAQPASSPPLRFTPGLAACRARIRGRVVRYSFLVRNFHPLLSAGLSRRFPDIHIDVCATRESTGKC